MTAGVSTRVIEVFSLIHSGTAVATDAHRETNLAEESIGMQHSRHSRAPMAGAVAILSLGLIVFACAQSRSDAQHATTAQPSPSAAPSDAVADAQTPRAVPATRPEQQKNEHDTSNVFAGPAAPHSSEALKQQPDEGEIKGFDFGRDALGAKKPMQTFEETMKQDIADKPKVMAAQRQLLE
jgi:hypothetical protein